QQVSWSEPAPVVALGVGLVALISFPILMLRRRDPLGPLSLFRNPKVRAIHLATLLVYAGLYVLLYVQNLFLQGVLGYSPIGAALIGLPTGRGLVFLAPLGGSMTR